jgi:hypothetical protein
MVVVCVSHVVIVFATKCMKLGKIVSKTKRRKLLSKYDIAQMTDGQREILFIGMSMERQRIIKLIKNQGEVWETVLISEIMEKIND